MRLSTRDQIRFLFYCWLELQSIDMQVKDVMGSTLWSEDCLVSRTIKKSKGNKTRRSPLWLTRQPKTSGTQAPQEVDDHHLHQDGWVPHHVNRSTLCPLFMQNYHDSWTDCMYGGISWIFVLSQRDFINYHVKARGKHSSKIQCPAFLIP